MNRPPFPEWCEAAPDATFSAPADCAHRASKFERRIRWRNGIEYGAGVLVIVLFSLMAGDAVLKGETLVAVSALMTVAAACFIMWSLGKRASNIERRPEDACVTHLIRQYRRQYEALQSIPRWYLAPLMPGFVLYYTAKTMNIAETLGWSDSLSRTGPLIVLSLAVFVIVGVANLGAARGLKRKYRELEALSQGDA